MKLKIVITLIAALTFVNLKLLAQIEINAKEIKQHITILASDSLEGRKPGTKGDKSAANYIVNDFKNNKLKLLFNNGSQFFNLVTDVKLGENNKLSINDEDIELGKGFIPFSFSGNATLKTSVCFVGYGFDVKTDSVIWDDYKNIDVSGKWIMMLRADPELDNFNSVFLPFSSERSKIVLAKDKGAKGIIFVSGKQFEEKDKLVQLSYDKTVKGAGIPVINITRETANKMLGDKTIESLESELNKSRKPNSFDLPVEITATTDIVQQIVISNNVVAILEGNDKILKEEYVVIGAHYDHLGYGGPNSGSRMPDTNAIHYGADDNASGVAAVLELAEKFASLKNNKRSIIFIAFGAEEMGLIGSKYFIDNTPVDKSKIVAMFNFDMLGRLSKKEPFLFVGGTGTALEIDSILNIYNENLPFEIKKSPDGYGPSDHANFYANNIPVIYFNTGVHSDYHTPKDVVDKINFEGEKQAVDYIFNIVNDVVNSDNKLIFKKSGSKTASRHGRRLKVTLGIIPDVAAGDVNGLKVIGTKKGKPAELGGMKSNDIIIAINGNPVTNIYDYMFRLSKLKAGETVIVEVKRRDEIKVLLIQL